MTSTNLTNATHDPDLKSWVESANDPATDFPIQNLGLCAFHAEHNDGGGHKHDHLGVVIGDQVLDLGLLAGAGAFDGAADAEALKYLLHQPRWNMLASAPKFWPIVRGRVQALLNAETHAGQQVRRVRAKALRPLAETPLVMPVHVGDYTDFYASKHHATNVGAMFRPDNPLLPNYKHTPIGYHGRASSIGVGHAGAPMAVRRPRGQTRADDAAMPTFGPCRLLDYETEIGAVVGAGNALGEPIGTGRVAEHIFGVCLVNDWSARDIQKWEYQPLGPFLAKNFATTISPVIVTMEALAPFRTPGPERAADDPPTLDYLRIREDWGLDLTVEVWLRSAPMRERGMSPVMLSRGSLRHMYWTLAQMVVHHASNGCNLVPGDLIASGTISGPDKTSRGCLLELTWEGHGPDGRPLPRKPIELPTGETRTFLADGDEVIMKGYAQREGFRRIGLGECWGRVEPAPA